MWIGLVNTVAYLTHGTLEAKGLEPGPREQFLGPRSKAALARWDGIFRTGATNVAVLGADAKLTQDMVRIGFGQGPSPDTGKTGSQSTAESTSIDSPRTSQSKHDCLKVSWRDGFPHCIDYGISKGLCRWALGVHNTCGYQVILHVLGNIGTGGTYDLDDGRRPYAYNGATYAYKDWRTKGWGIREIL